jgi:hypothetical protein
VDFDSKIAIKQHFPERWLNLDEGIAESMTDYFYKKYKEDRHVPHFHIPVSKLQAFFLEIMENTIRALDSAVGTPRQEKYTRNFWAIWLKMHTLNRANGTTHFAPILLLKIGRKPEAKHWQPLTGKTKFLKELLSYYGRVNLSAAISLLATIGDETLMPAGVSIIAAILRESKYQATTIERPVCVVFIQRAFFDYGKVIKGHPQLLEDFIFVLDVLVDTGMTEAFQIRDYLITFKA